MDIPIIAFSHSPAMIAAVSKSGGFGVLGAAEMEPEELDQALKHISQEFAGKAFGIDLIIPDNYIGTEQSGFTLEELQKAVPMKQSLTRLRCQNSNLCNRASYLPERKYLACW